MAIFLSALKTIKKKTIKVQSIINNSKNVLKTVPSLNDNVVGIRCLG